jgi:peptidoglycan hydrolase-like protein with peptidoglycan-binding domain
MKPFEKILKIGDEGDLVSDLQARLISLGVTSCFLSDGSVGTLDEPTGYFGEVTQQCLVHFQAQALDAIVEEKITTPDVPFPKDATGEMDFYTHWVLNNYEQLSECYKVEVEPEEVTEPEEKPVVPPDDRQAIINEVLKLATGELGVVESGGNNYGKRVQEYQEIGSNGAISGGQPWCDYFQKFLLITGCADLKLLYKATYSGYTPYEVDDWGKKHGITHKNPKIDDVKVGDWGFVYSSSRGSACHIFIVTGKKGNNVTTIEGNTNPGGGSDGYGVFKRTRACPWAVVRWADLY